MTANNLREEVLKEIVNQDSHYDCDWYNFGQLETAIDLAIQKARSALLDEIEKEITEAWNEDIVWYDVIDIIKQFRTTPAPKEQA